MKKKKLGIVLFNLGGPDRPESIKPFLLNLFRDPAILSVPFFIRPFLARWITRARLKPATENYAHLGGRSPLLEFTQRQALALEAALPEYEKKCVIAMRYWHPFSDEAAKEMRAWSPDEIFLLPLYPHYSTTTTGSSLTAWREAAARAGLAVPTTTLCCYPTDPGFIAAITRLIDNAYTAARATVSPASKIRVLFSAHGLPESVIKSGDPYQHQIESTVAAVIKTWGEKVDWRICYQSRATPQKWLSPSTDEEIHQAAADKISLLIVPIAFVSDHAETLVELDIEYRALAKKLGVPGYFRAPVANDNPAFITALADLVRQAKSQGPGLCAATPHKFCPTPHKKCPHALAGTQA